MFKNNVFIYRVIKKFVPKLKELIEGMKYNSFRIGTHGLGSNPDSVHEGQLTN